MLRNEQFLLRTSRTRDEGTGIILISFARTLSSETSNNLLQVTQPVSGRIRTLSQVPAPAKLELLDTTHL